MVSRWRFELQTPWLKVKCSTDWASETKNKDGCLGWIRTNGMQESKSCALPLGYEAIKQVVERHGFEPWNPKEQIYSLPRLATSLTLQKMVPKTGIEPVTYWLQVSCSTNWAISAKKNKLWWAMRDSNSRPPACKADALTNWANRPFFLLMRL